MFLNRRKRDTAGFWMIVIGIFIKSTMHKRVLDTIVGES